MVTRLSPPTQGSESAGINLSLSKLFLLSNWFTTIRRFYTLSKVDPVDAP